MELAQALPFRFKSRPGIAIPGALATKDQIAAEWAKLKGNPGVAHDAFTAFDPLTELELSDDAMNSLILTRVTDNESFLKHQPWFKDFDTWPADAQLGLLSMAWAMGPDGPGQFPHFRAACQAMDFNTAAAQSQMDATQNPGLVPRNKANSVLFSNAAMVLAGEAKGSFQRSVLYYPQALKTGGPESTG
ncbi:MAG TPA: hypothetical protein VIY49_07675 [Bryobacteraceae bacterium]